MSAFPVLPYWCAFTVLLAAQIGLIVLAGLAWEPRLGAPRRRALWHAGFIAISLVSLAAMAGAWSVLVPWLNPHQTATLPTVPEPAARVLGTAERRVKFPANVAPESAHLAAPARPSLAARPAPLAESTLQESPANAWAPTPPPSLSPLTTPNPPWNWLKGIEFGWLALWSLGTMIALMRVGLACCLTLWLRWRRPACEDSELVETIRRLECQLGCARPIALRTSPGLSGPIAFGLRHPTIILPAHFVASYSAVQRQAMLAHETAHLAAADPAWNLLADAVSALFWWHPLVWRARQALSHASELAADEASLVVPDGPRILAECLLALGGRPWRPHSAAWLGIEGRFRSGLGRRVARLVDLQGQAIRPPAPRSALGLKTAAATLVATITLLGSAWAMPQALTKGDPMTQFKHTWKHSLASLTLAASLGGTPAITAAETPAPGLEASESIETNSPSELNPPTTHRQTASKARPMSEAMMKRYGWAPGDLPSTSSRDEIAQKLKTISFETIEFSPSPTLGQALKHIAEAARQQFGEEFNFIISQVPNPNRSGQTIFYDQAQGQYTYPADASAIGLGLDGPLRNITLQGVLEILTQVASEPVRYSINNFGIVFTRGAAEIQETETVQRAQMSTAMMKRYGLTPATPPAVESAAPVASNHLRNTLKTVVFPEFKLPAGKSFQEAAHILRQQISAQAPDQQAVNIIIAAYSTPPLPTVPIRGEISLKQINALDVLEVFTQLLSLPVHYVITDNYILFLPNERNPERAIASSSATAKPSARAPRQLLARSFKIDQAHFYKRLEDTFGIATPNEEDAVAKTRAAVIQLASQLGVVIEEPAKEVFYNRDSGMLMIRASAAGLDTLAAALETLGCGSPAKF